MIQQIDERCEFYAGAPQLGDICEELETEIRRFHAGRSEVLNRSQSGGIVVLLVVHSSRDIPAAFRAAFEGQS